MPGTRATHRRPLRLTAAVLGGLLTAALLAPAAEARYPYGTARDTSVQLAADEVLTVDVLGVDDPGAGATWVRSSVCLWDGSCAQRVERSGVVVAVNPDGTLTTYRRDGTGGKVDVFYVVEDTAGGRYSARLRITAQPGVPLATDPDPSVRTRLRVATWKRFLSFDHAGQEVRFVSTVANKGDVALEDLRLTNASPNIPAPTCTPVPVGGTLPAWSSTTCTSVLTVTQDLVDLNVQRVSSPVATGRVVRGGITYRARAAAIASASPVQVPHLSMTGSVQPDLVTSPDQPLAYAFVVRNDGKVTVRNLLVRAPFPGLSALVCAPVTLGGTLAPGVSTTCRATRTVPPERLGSTTLTDTARASAQTYWRTVNAVSETSVTVRTAPAGSPAPAQGAAPVARPDTVTTSVGRPVVVRVLANDSAGSAPVPLVGPSLRLRLTPELDNPQLYGDAKTLIVPPVFNRPVEPLSGGLAFLASGRGEITVVPLSTVPAEPMTIGYQVADAAGVTTRSTLTVTVEP